MDGSDPGSGGERLRRRLRQAGALARALGLRAGVRLTGGQGPIGSRLARRAVPLEASPFLETGRRAPRARPSALGLDDYRRLLGVVRDLGPVPYETLGDAATGVGLRLDLGTGLTERALALSRLEAQADVPSLKAISAFVAGDLLAFSEGRLGIEPRAWPLLRALGRSNGRRFVVLNELPDALLASQADPWRLYAELENAFRKRRLPLLGFVTGLGTDPATDLAWLLLHRGAWQAIPDELLADYGLLANELRRPGEGARRVDGLPRPAADFDWIERIELEPIAAAASYSRRLRRSVTRGFRPRRVSRLPTRLETTPEGFQIRDRDGHARALVATDAALEALRRAAATGPVAVICDVAHLAGPEASADRETLRTLPHPFHHALAFSSDVDWSSEAQVREGFARLNGELGLPVAGSFFVEGPPAASLAALPIPPDVEDGLGVVAELAARGGMDTLHAFRSNVHSLPLVREGDGFVLAAGAGPVRAEAFLVRAEGDLSAATLHVATDTEDWKLAPEPGAGASGALACFAVPDAWRRRGLVCETLRVRVEGATAHEVTVTDFAAGSAREALARVADDGLAPLVFTTHGGGAPDVVRYGNLHVGAALDDAASDMDRADRPYHLLPDLIRLGVRFFSPRGHAGIATLQPADGLVTEAALRDGSRVGLFRRFLSRRQGPLGLPESFAFGKNAANPAALGFQISDLLLRFHWATEGQAAILYNHFGHNVGNQCCDRLAWSEELHGAFERVAALHHPDGGSDEPAYRLWVCPPSRLLLHDRVRRGAAPHVRVAGSDVSLAAFHDDLLGVDPTDAARFGTRLLHGLTFFVEDAARARLEIAGAPIHAFTRNAAGAGERESVSIVDDSAPRAVLLAENRLAESRRSCRVEAEADAFDVALEGPDAEVTWTVPAVPLDAATHWSAAWDAPAEGTLEIAFCDARGVWYRAAGDGGGDWRLPADAGAPGYFALADRQGGAHGPPRSAWTGVRVRVQGGRAGDRVGLRRVVLLRPDAHLRDRREARRLAGRILSEGPFESAGLRVEAQRVDGEGTWRAPVLADGRFVLRGLPADARVRCELVRAERRTTSLRGAEAWLLSDLVGWDFRVDAGDGLGGGR